MSAEERTCWRDAEISARHREWGFNCPATDLDFLAVEYNVGLPVALVEYKKMPGARMPDVKHPTYRALNELANRARIPFLIAFYAVTPWWFQVWPVNDLAARHYQNGELLTERGYVSRLYHLRHLVIESSVLCCLSDELPTWAKKDAEST